MRTRNLTFIRILILERKEQIILLKKLVSSLLFKMHHIRQFYIDQTLFVFLSYLARKSGRKLFKLGCRCTSTYILV